MPATGFQTSSLLHYNADYRVLICRECQYAIQKSAIDSHLLKHKIYRNERQELLTEIAKLVLLEPEDVLEPRSGSSPVKFLPVLQGYRCTIAGCRHLTVSEKRAKRHWSERHSHGETNRPFSEYTSSVNLQTFFKGTKVKYFEVLPSAEETVSEKENGNGPRFDRQSEFHSRLSDSRAETGTATTYHLLLDSQVSISTPFANAIPQVSITLDLETLKYFHHFITITASTLPGPPDYWQSKVVTEALQHHGVMCGLLAISVCHLAVLSTELSNIQFYIERHAMLYDEFSRTHHHETQSETDSQNSEATDPSREFVHRIISLLRCLQWAVAEISVRQAIDDPPSLEVILDAIRGCIIYEHALSTASTTEDGSEADRNNARESHSALLDFVRNLPLRMVEVLGKPESAEDLFATLSTIDTLVECCKISFGSDELDPVWQGVSEWLTKVSPRFKAMLNRQDPAAMVVLAHWATILVKRAEDTGCWFLKGSSKIILVQIVNQLSATNPTVLCLVNSLVPDLN